MQLSRSRTVNASPEAVWQAIVPVESLPQWLSGVESASHTGGPEMGAGRLQRVRRIIYTRDVDIDQEVTGWEPPRYMEVRHLRERIGDRELGGVRNFRTAVAVSPQGSGARIQLTYVWDARMGLAWLFSRLFAGRTMGRELSDSLRKLQALVDRPQA